MAVRVFAAFLVARALFGLAYLAAAAGKLPIFWYYPLDHRWALSAEPTGPAMGWFGLGGIAYLAAARGPIGRALARASVVVAIAHAGGLVLLVDFAYFGWTLTHQPVKPWAPPACAPDGSSR
jgi:hypothetical protein